MPRFESKNTVELTAKGVFALFLVALVFASFLAFASGYPSLGVLCLSVVGIIGGFWLIIASQNGNKENIGAWILLLSVIVFFLNAWLGTPIEEWNKLTESQAELSSLGVAIHALCILYAS